MSSTKSKLVLLTGATGFLGKVTLFELLSKMDSLGVSQVVLIIRKRDEVKGVTRFLGSVAKSRCFSSLSIGWQDSVRVLEGNLTLRNCGLHDEDYSWLSENVTHIIHVAGHIKFDGKVSELLGSNVVSALNVLELAQSCKMFERFVNTSTAFSTPPTDSPIHERLSTLPGTAEQLFKKLVEGELNKQQALDLTGHSNFYSLSKCLAEHLLVEKHGSVPLTIVRPSIICASWEKPEPGWIDSKAAFGGFVTAFATGILTVVNGQPDARLDIIPVDRVASCLVEEAFIIEERPSIALLPPKIMFCVATKLNSFTLNEACHLLTAFFRRRHAGRRPPTFKYIGSRDSRFYIYEFLYHWIPSKTMSSAFRMIGKQEKAIEAQRSYRLGATLNSVFAPYTNHTYDFRPSRSKYPFQDKQLYMERICQGVSAHLMQPNL